MEAVDHSEIIETTENLIKTIEDNFQIQTTIENLPNRVLNWN